MLRNAVNPTTLVALLLAAILIFLVANPLFQLVKDSFSNTSDHSFTFANYVTAFGRPRYVQALVHSMELGAVAAFIASIIAVPLAWGVSRTDMPGARFRPCHGAGVVPDPALCRRHRLDIAGRSQRRLDQQGVDRRHRAAPAGTLQYLHLLGPGAGHRHFIRFR